MKQFEYDITVHSADAFKELVYFCTSEGDCYEEATPANFVAKFANLLNSRGQQGWELVSTNFSARGLVSFWKREIE